MLIQYFKSEKFEDLSQWIKNWYSWILCIIPIIIYIIYNFIKIIIYLIQILTTN